MWRSLAQRVKTVMRRFDREMGRAAKVGEEAVRVLRELLPEADIYLGNNLGHSRGGSRQTSTLTPWPYLRTWQEASSSGLAGERKRRTTSLPAAASGTGWR